MTMNPAMLLFGLVDSGIAFFLVFYICRAKFGGMRSLVARTIGTILGTIVFTVYFGVIVWFNTVVYTVSQSVKLTVYLAPIVLTILMTALVLLSQPTREKKKTAGNKDENDTDIPESDEQLS